MATLEQEKQRLAELKRLRGLQVERQSLVSAPTQVSPIPQEAPILGQGPQIGPELLAAPQPAATTDTGADAISAAIREEEFRKQPRLQQGPDLPFFPPQPGQFLTGGVFSEQAPPSQLELNIRSALQGLIGPDVVSEKFGDIPPDLISQQGLSGLAGELLPLGASARIGGGILRAGGRELAERGVPFLQRLLTEEAGESVAKTVARRGLRETTTGAVFETGRQAARAATGEEFEPSRIAETAGIFGGVGAVLPAAGAFARFVKRDLGKEVAKKATEAETKRFVESLGPTREPSGPIEVISKKAKVQPSKKFGRTGLQEGEFDRIIETAETGKPFQANLFRTETKGRKDFAGGGVFVGTEKFVDVLKPVLGGKKTAVAVDLTNPIIINSKPQYIKTLAESGDKAAQAMIDKSTGFPKDDIPLNRIDSFVARRAREAGHDGIININEMEIQIIKGSGIKAPVRTAEPIPTKPVTLKQVSQEKAEAERIKTLGLSKAEQDNLRRVTNRQALSPVERKSFDEMIGEGKRSNLKENALSIANEVNRNPRQLTIAEQGGIVLKEAELIGQFDEAVKMADDLFKIGDTRAAEVARARMESIAEEIDILSDGLRKGRREIARGLVFGRAVLDLQTFDLARLTQRFRVAKGSKLSAKDLSEARTLAEKGKSLEKQVADLEKVNAQLVFDAEKKSAEIVVKGRAAFTKKRTGLIEENADIKKDLVALGFRLSDITGLTIEGSYQVGRLAINYIKQGVSTLDGVIRKVRSDFPEVSVDDVVRAVNQRNPKVQAKARSEVTKRIAKIKQKAKLIDDLDKAFKGIFKAKKGRRSEGPEVAALRRAIRRLRKISRESTADPDRLERALQTLDELQDQLATGFRPFKKQKPLEPAALRSIKEKISDVRKELRADDELARLNKQLELNEFESVAKPEPRKISPQLERKQIELKVLRRQVRRAIEEKKPTTVGSVGTEIVNTLRTIKATADFSATARQGLVLSARRPKTAAVSFGKAMKAFFSNNTAEQIDNSIRQNPKHFLRERAGLELQEIGGPRGAREEVFMSNALDRIPGLREVVRASERHFTSYLNMIRTAAFDDFLVKFPNATRDELQAWAQWINVTSGRGKLAQTGTAARILSTVFFAPKFAVSRVQTPFVALKNLKRPRVRREIAKDIAATGSLVATTLALAKMGGLEVGTDYRDSDFGAVIVGNTRFDIFAGFRQPIKLIVRLGVKATDEAGFTGKDLKEVEKEFDFIDAFGRFVSYKLAPSVTLGNEILTGRTIVGEETTPSETAIRAIMPIVIEDIFEAYKDQGVGKAAAVAPFSLLGVGASTFEKGKKKPAAGRDLKSRTAPRTRQTQPRR